MLWVVLIMNQIFGARKPYMEGEGGMKNPYEEN